MGSIFSFQQIINGLQLGAIYALIALGYTMVYGIVRLINFAHGDFFMVGAFAAYGAFFLFHAFLGQGGPMAFLVLIVAINRKGTTVLLVEQNASEALEIADFAYVLEVGYTTISGPAKDIAADPRVREAYLGV